MCVIFGISYVKDAHLFILYLSFFFWGVACWACWCHENEAKPIKNQIMLVVLKLWAMQKMYSHCDSTTTQLQTTII